MKSTAIIKVAIGLAIGMTLLASGIAIADCPPDAKQRCDKCMAKAETSYKECRNKCSDQWKSCAKGCDVLPITSSMNSPHNLCVNDCTVKRDTCRKTGECYDSGDTKTRAKKCGCWGYCVK